VNEEQLRRRAGERRAILDRSWAYLRKLGFVEEALDRPFDEEMVRYIIEKYDEFAAASPGTGNRKQTVDQERNVLPVSLSESELQRKAAFEEYVAMRAACDTGTRRFRNWVLGGRLLTARQARELVRSPAARFLEANSFDFAGGDIPLIGHHATLEPYEGERDRGREYWHRATISVDPPGITKTVEKPSCEEPQLASWRARKMDGGGGQLLHFVNERGRARQVSVWSWSLLEELRTLCERLTQQYRWEPAQATMFVLTGEIPAVPALKATSSFRFSERQLDATTTIPEYLDTTITITASAWVPSKTVARAYRTAQTMILGGNGGRAPGLKNLTLFRFVTERIPPSSEPATQEDTSRAPKQLKASEGKRLVSEWNAAYPHPKWTYKTSAGDLDTRRFWRDYHRIKRTIAVGPPYQMDHAATRGNV
jgi:hypothetical protein